MAIEAQWVRRSEEILDKLAISAVKLHLEAGLAPKEVYARMAIHWSAAVFMSSARFSSN